MKTGKKSMMGFLLILTLAISLGIDCQNQLKVANDQRSLDQRSLRHLVPNRWWDTVAGLKIVTLKKGRRYGHEISIEPVKASEQLDEIKAQGFQVIEIFAPAEGLYAYSGLDTKNHYRIDPEIGTMDDFRRLVRLTHSKGLAIIVFINIGYFSVEAPDWLEACRDKKLGKDSEKVRWFLWSDRADAPSPVAQEDIGTTEERRNKTKYWGWQYSNLAGSYFWARWRARDNDGNDIPLPQNNWGSKEWRKEAEQIVRFWMDTGIDGMLIDAPLCYPRQTWEHNRRHISEVIASYGNTYIQPEGAKDVAWITEGGYNAIQDYGMGWWGNSITDGLLTLPYIWQENSIIYAIENGDPRPIEESLRISHDVIVNAGGGLYHNVRSFDDDVKRHLERATVAAIGDILAYSRRAGSPDAEETWILETKRLHPALHQLSTRRKLETNADDKYYSFLRTAAGGSERILVVLNFQATPQAVEVDLSGVATAGLVELKYGEYVERQSPFKVELPAYGYRFYQVLSAK